MATPDSVREPKRTPGWNERLIGSLILILLALLVSVFLLSGGLFAGFVERMPALQSLRRLIGPREQPLFALARGSLKPSASPLETRIAAMLLPAEMPGSYQVGCRMVYVVRSGEQAEVLSEMEDGSGGSSIERTTVRPEGLVKDAAASGARFVYSAPYLKDKAIVFRVDVVDAGEPANAMKLCEARRSQGAESLALGRGGWVAASPPACGFWAGRYYTQVSGAGQQAADVAVLQGAAKAAAAGQLVYGGPFERASATKTEVAEGTRPAPGARAVADGVARFAAVEGGQALPPTRIERYTDNLYEKIDGKEGMFRAFHFVELRFGQYTDARTQEAFDTYIYDMGEPVNAFGIYMGERSPTAAAWPLGRDGYASGTSVYFCKDKYYVNVLGPPEGGDDKLEVSKAIATAIAATIPDTDKPFWVEQYLPAEGRVPHTLKYEATSGLGYDFMQRVFTVGYKTGDRKYQVFLVQTGGPAEADSLFDQFAEATAKYDKVVSKTSGADGQILVGESLGTFTVAFTKGRFFGGVTECDDQTFAVRQAEALRARLPGGAEDSVGSSAGTKPAADFVPADAQEGG